MENPRNVIENQLFTTKTQADFSSFEEKFDGKLGSLDFFGKCLKIVAKENFLKKSVTKTNWTFPHSIKQSNNIANHSN
jgi:hypothetical protein